MLWFALLLASAAQSAGQSTLPNGGDTPRQFPSRVELVAVELIVVDGNGRPISDLAPGDFRLEVEGQPRRVMSAEYMPVALEPEDLPATTGGDTGFSSNEAARPGRLVLLILDTSNIEMGKGRDEVEAAMRVLDRLGPTDRVGLLTIPASGPREEFTSDHERIRAAMATLVGRGFTGRNRLALVEALSGSEPQRDVMDQERWAEALRRECGDRPSEMCIAGLASEAWQVASEYRETSLTSRAVLISAFEALQKVEGQKVVVLVTQGLGFPEMGARPGSAGLELRRIVTPALAANVALYIVPVRASAASVGTVPRHLVDEDRRLHFSGLEMLATNAGGAILRGEPERAFARVLRETSGYYRLGFEPEGDDRNGKPRKLRVSVSREGAVVRARPKEVLRAAAPSQTRGDLVAALRSPTLATALPLRVATWSLAGSEPGKVQLLIGAEIGAEAEPHGLAVGYVVLDAQGKVVASASQPLRDETLAASGPLPYSASATIAPGAYTLRLAVRDGRGRLGSVEHKVEAGLVKAGPFALGELLLGRVPEPGQRFRPAVVAEAVGDALLVHGEIYDAAETTLDTASATLEVVASDTGATVRTLTARVAPASTPGRRVVQALLPVSDLAPGRYLVRIVVSEGQLPRGAVVRPFRVVALSSPATGS